MTERISRIGSPADIEPTDALDVIDLKLQELVDAGVDEDVARASLKIGTTEAIEDQTAKFERNPGAYLLYRRDGRIKGILKYTNWNKYDEANYTSGPVEAFVGKVNRIVTRGRFLRPRLGFQALTAANSEDQDYVIESLVFEMLNGRTTDEAKQAIVVPLHENDPALKTMHDYSFQPTDKTSESVTLRVGGENVIVPMEQRLHIRPANPQR